jgi:hypothetical protein
MSTKGETKAAVHDGFISYSHAATTGPATAAAVRPALVRQA